MEAFILMNENADVNSFTCINPSFINFLTHHVYFS